VILRPSRTAPGAWTLSTVPTWARCTSSYNRDQYFIAISPPGILLDAPSLLSRPAPTLLAGSSIGCSSGSDRCGVSGELVDCGLGLSPCVGAQGKVCLIQRGQATFCTKVLNCLAGGGIAAVIYNLVSVFSLWPFNLTCDTDAALTWLLMPLPHMIVCVACRALKIRARPWQDP